jgi:hypothetical protein
MYVTASEFAVIHKVHVSRICALAAAGRIRGARKLGRQWLIPARARVDHVAHGQKLQKIGKT